MSAPKFTPGPWSFQLCASDKTVYQLLDAHGTVIGFPRAGTGGNAEKASFLANARLIAAAPELYEALAGMLSIHDSVTMGQEQERRDEWVPKARAALAKAVAP